MFLVMCLRVPYLVPYCSIFMQMTCLLKLTVFFAVCWWFKNVSCDTKCSLQLQNDINKLVDWANKLVDWANKWQLNFDISKCYILHLGKLHGYGEYNIQGTNITSTDKIKDLGVIIDSNLKFHDHVNSVIISKANQINTRHYIVRLFSSQIRNQIFVTLYKTI